MQAVFVVSKNGKPLMPTFNPKKVRKLLKSKRAEIYRHEPFTIRLLYDTTEGVQPVEYCTDTGYQHAGVSVKSAKHEYWHHQADMLEDEKQNHDDRRKHRKARRNRLRHRQPRFNNRKNRKGQFAPSLQNRMDNQVRIYQKISEICPITSAHLEVAKFDIQALEAIEAGKEISGTDYQHGPRYKHDTLREAVFWRDSYTCQVCGKSPLKDHKTILHMHHCLFWKDDHTDRMAALMTVCTGCHTSANHKPGGKLWGLEVKSSNKAPQAFMNTVRWRMYASFKEVNDNVPVRISYGAVTKRERLTIRMPKTHANDAYCIGEFRPAHKTAETHTVKKRRNNRVLERFYDAIFIDTRDGEKKSGSQLSCGRTKRKESRYGEKNQRIYRGQKVSKGHRNIRKKRYKMRPGDHVLYNRKVYVVHGTQNNGTTLALNITKTIPLASLQPKMSKEKQPRELPIQVGQKLALRGKKERHEVLHIDESTETAVMRWYMGVKPDQVKTLTYNYGGWNRT